MAKHPKFDKIEDFLTGQLSSDEAKSFENQMESDPELASEFQLQKLEHDAMERMLETDLKSKMAKWDTAPPPNPFENERPSPKPGKGLWYAILGVLGILIIWGITQMFPSENLPPETPNEQTETVSPPETKLDEVKSEEPKQERPIAEMPVETPAEKEEKSPKKPTVPKQNPYRILAMNNYETPNNFGTIVRSEGNETEQSDYEKAVEAFQKDDSKNALKFIETPAKNENSAVTYLRGHIYFKLKDFAKAQTEFKSVADNFNAPEGLEAEWFLLLTYLAQMPDEQDNFEALASKLAADEYSDYREKAKELSNAVSN